MTGEDARIVPHAWALQNNHHALCKEHFDWMYSNAFRSVTFPSFCLRGIIRLHKLRTCSFANCNPLRAPTADSSNRSARCRENKTDGTRCSSNQSLRDNRTFSRYISVSLDVGATYGCSERIEEVRQRAPSPSLHEPSRRSRRS